MTRPLLGHGGRGVLNDLSSDWGFIADLCRTSILYYGEKNLAVYSGLTSGLDLLGLYDYQGYNAYILKPVLSGRNL